MKTQTLKCAAGHEWTRPSQRGKPPRFCPEHKPAPTPSEASSAPAAPNATVRLCESALDRQDALTDPEAVRQVDYLVGRLLGIEERTPRDDDHKRDLAADTAMLSHRLTDLIRVRA